MRRVARTDWWWERARCAGDWELFDSTNAFDHRKARQVCTTCPVFAACHEEMLELLATPEATLVGTWAGILFSDKGHPNRRVVTTTVPWRKSRRRQVS